MRRGGQLTHRLARLLPASLVLCVVVLAAGAAPSAATNQGPGGGGQGEGNAIANGDFAKVTEDRNPAPPIGGGPIAKHQIAGWSLGTPEHSTLGSNIYPRVGASVATACVPDEEGRTPYLQLDVPRGSRAFAEQTITVPALPGPLEFTAWGNYQAVAASVVIVTADGTAHRLAGFSPPTLGPRPDRSCVAGAAPRQFSVDVSAFAGQRVTLRFEATSGGDDGTIANFDHVRLRPQAGHEPGIDYVALGDSVSSGEGDKPYESGTATDSDKCHRSLHDAYPKDLRLPGVRIARFHFYACSGAKTTDMRSDGFKSEIPQLDHEAELRRADLVTFTIGTNDAGFSKVLKECLARSCTDKANEERTIARIAGLGGTLVETYLATRAAAPHAKIVVLDYPNPFPKLGVGRFLSCYSDSPAVLGVSGVNFLHARGEELDAVIEAAVRTANEKGADVRFLEIRPAFADHDVCAKDPWFRSLELSAASKQNQAVFVDTGSFHPTPAGQQAYARVLADSLKGVFG